MNYLSRMAPNVPLCVYKLNNYFTETGTLSKHITDVTAECPNRLEYINSQKEDITYLSCAHLLYKKCALLDVLTHCGVYGGIPGVYSHFSHSTPLKTPSLAYICVYIVVKCDIQ